MPVPHGWRSGRWWRSRWRALLALGSASLVIAGCSVAGPPGVPNRLPSFTCASVRSASATMNPAPAASTAGGHRTYSLTSLGPVPRQLTWHAGTTVRFVWCAIPGPMTADPRAGSVALGANIEGPFPSRAAAAAAQRAGAVATHGPRATFPQVSTPPDLTLPRIGPIVARAQPLHTDTWSGSDQTATIVLAKSLAPGFYVFQTAMDVFPPPGANEPTTSGGSGGIIQVTPS
jgi:hypothetical protein